MCKLYSLTKGQQAIREFTRAMVDRAGNMPALPGIFPDQMASITVTTTITDISLAKLIPSPANARRTGAGAGIEALAASIEAHGWLQSLVVRPKLDGSGEPTGRYEVIAGGRRLAALKLLAKQKQVSKGIIIPCRVLDSEGVDGTEASLAENVVRQDMHPADQFEAFQALHEGGTGIEDIAARFGVSPHTVRQRLRLACVSPALIQAYRDEVLTLDHLTAFAVTEDREAQERVFGQLQEWQRSPDTIRRLLTHALIPASDPQGDLCRAGRLHGGGRHDAARPVQRGFRRLDYRCGLAGAACRRTHGAGSRGDPGRKLALGCHQAGGAICRMGLPPGVAEQGGLVRGGRSVAQRAFQPL